MIRRVTLGNMFPVSDTPPFVSKTIPAILNNHKNKKRGWMKSLKSRQDTVLHV